MTVTVYGAPYSVYVRIVHLALEEKGVAYRLEEVDIFADGGPPERHLARHPFSKIPAFDHDGFGLHETGAITRYVDATFEGPPLFPSDLKSAARTNQIMSIVDSYAYTSLVWGVYTGAVADLRDGETRDEAAIAAAVQRSRRCLGVISDLRGESPWLAGDNVSLADLYLAPMMGYFLVADDGKELWQEITGLHDWWAAMTARSSMKDTRANDMVA